MSPGHIHPPHDRCLAVREVLNRVGDKWSVFIVAMLGAGPLRFSELRRSIEGISQRMLTLTLRGLERDGLVSRAVYATVPPRVEYALTPLGQTLLVPVQALAGWAEEHRAEIQQARERFDRRSARRKESGRAEQAAEAPHRAPDAGVISQPWGRGGAGPRSR